MKASYNFLFLADSAKLSADSVDRRDFYQLLGNK